MQTAQRRRYPTDFHTTAFMAVKHIHFVGKSVPLNESTFSTHRKSTVKKNCDTNSHSRCNLTGVGRGGDVIDRADEVKLTC